MRILLALAACFLAAPLVGADPSPAASKAHVAPHTIVAGFESQYRDPATPAVDGGLLLLGELNCTSCHKADDKTAAMLLPKIAPYLGDIAGRADPKFLQRFIADPHGVKPGTTMPGLLTGLPPEEAAKTATALTHYLASQAKTKFLRTSVATDSIARGQDLFHKIGCVACHAPRQERAAKATDDEDDDAAAVDLAATSIPLSHKLHEKYSLAGLAAFLSDPLKTRPSGRMPNLNLSQGDVADIGQFLLKDTIAPALLTLSYYEGSWDKLPDFAKLTPKKVGNANGFGLAGFAGKDNFGLVIEGFLRIEKAGDYKFFLVSDDGSRLLIDGKKVVDYDGTHPPGEVSGRVKLEPGLHSIRVEYFEASVGEELKVTWEGPGFKREPIPSSLLSSSDKPADPEDVFTVDAVLAKQGEALFTSIGCANCHQMEPEKALASKFVAKELSALKPEGGCLADAPKSGLPRYTLSGRQKETLVAALRAIGGNTLLARNTPDAIHARMTALNCYACHQRGEIGGPIRERDPYFTANSPDLGDEGRVPPRLTGVGDKLLPEWFVTVLTKGGVARPYMDTRMPQFGAANLGPIAAQFTEVDLKNTPIPVVEIKAADLKKHGQTLVGKEGLSCVSCHMFGKYRSLGIQAMDLTGMKDRLRPEWFHKYMLEPSALRPGTRMPQAFINGKSTFTKVLNADADPQIAAIWTYLSDGRKAKTPIGVIPIGNELVVNGEALIYRNFITDAGPRAIGVGYPEEVNLAFDANHNRLALIWQGKFMDAALHWEGRGQGYQPPLGDHVVKLPTGPTFAVLETPESAWPKGANKNVKDPTTRFHGYHLDELRRPTFKYDLLLPDNRKVAIVDSSIGVEDDKNSHLARTFTLSAENAVPKIYARLAAGKIESVKQGYLVDNAIVISVPNAVLRPIGNQQELLLPIDVAPGKPTEFRVDYRWPE